MKQVNRSLILIGFMGTGKSTLGNVLAEKLNRQQVDLEDVIVKEQNMAISDIFARYGEAKFRELEHDVLCRYAAKPGLIISPGGGAALRAENRAVMKEHGIVISLWARPEVILERVNRDSVVRPVLENRKPGQIISPGGGAALRAENRAVMKEHGIVISLWARPEVILERVNRDSVVRPVLENRKPGQSRLERIEEVLAERMSCYKEADFMLDTSDESVDALVAKVLAWLEDRAGEEA